MKFHDKCMHSIFYELNSIKRDMLENLFNIMSILHNMLECVDTSEIKY